MRLVIATRNAHKVAEIRAILGELYEYVTLLDLPGAPEVVEDAETFEGNAMKKASALADWLSERGKYPEALVLADDSGLEVDALGGAPGVHSARFAALDERSASTAKNSADQENNAKLLRLLENVPAERRTARFRCAIALAGARVDARLGPTLAQVFEGKCEGRIGLAPTGSGGFGYDPLFIPNGYTQSFAELGEEVKNKLSHRAQALENLKAHLAGPA
jgi:XTP/dITP diphosphohydrolase